MRNVPIILMACTIFFLVVIRPNIEISFEPNVDMVHASALKDRILSRQAKMSDWIKTAEHLIILHEDSVIQTVVVFGDTFKSVYKPSAQVKSDARNGYKVLMDSISTNALANKAEIP